MSEWISVKDKLPENDDLVLVYPDKYEIALNFYPWNDFKSYKKNCFYEMDEHGFIHNHEYITHWMPFPEPPVTQK